MKRALIAICVCLLAMTVAAQMLPATDIRDVAVPIECKKGKCTIAEKDLLQLVNHNNMITLAYAAMMKKCYKET